MLDTRTRTYYVAFNIIDRDPNSEAERHRIPKRLQFQWPMVTPLASFTDSELLLSSLSKRANSAREETVRKHGSLTIGYFCDSDR